MSNDIVIKPRAEQLSLNPIIEFILKTIFRFILKKSTHLNRVHTEEMVPK
jgi:hypothetical protein